MIQQTSLFAYQDAQHSIGKRHQQILDCLGYDVLNNREISEITKLPINCVTPRVNELVKMGLIREVKKGKDPVTNRTTIFWKGVN